MGRSAEVKLGSVWRDCEDELEFALWALGGGEVQRGLLAVWHTVSIYTVLGGGCHSPEGHRRLVVCISP